MPTAHTVPATAAPITAPFVGEGLSVTGGLLLACESSVVVAVMGFLMDSPVEVAAVNVVVLMVVVMGSVQFLPVQLPVQSHVYFPKIFNRAN